MTTYNKKASSLVLSICFANERKGNDSSVYADGPVFGAALVAGAVNAVAGGGSFFTFPSLAFSGMLPVTANATSTIGLWLGSVASIGAYRRELTSHKRLLLWLLIGTSLTGGILGAILLLHTPQGIFVTLLPYLLFTATVLFIFSGPITKRLQRHHTEKRALSPARLVCLALAQLLISIYGGYFGGGIGILMLTTLTMMGMEDIHMMNGLKVLLAACINGVAIVTFILAGAIVWLPAGVITVGAIIGGYGGAYYARKIDQKWIRLFVISVGVTLTLYFFLHH